MKRSARMQDASKLKVSVFWGDILYDTAICYPNESITVGRDAGNTFILDLPMSRHRNSFKLVKVGKDNSAELKFDDELSGHVRLGNELLSLASAKKSDKVTRDGSGVYSVRLGQSDKA